MNTDLDSEKHESKVKFFRTIAAFMAIVAFIFIAVVCVLLVLLLIYGWQLVYLI